MTKVKSAFISFSFFMAALALTVTADAQVKGKIPFGILYYGCHGAAYLDRPADYDAPWAAMARADSLGVLTPLGHDVMQRLGMIRADARNRWGELTEAGARQQQEIAQRIVERFPEIFNGEANHLGARSLTNTCCLLSMEQMMVQVAKACRIRVYHNASKVYSDYLDRQEERQLAVSRDSVAGAAYRNLSAKYGDGLQLAKRLFTDVDVARGHVDVQALCDQLYRLAANIGQTRLDGRVSLDDLFTEDEVRHQRMRLDARNYLNYGGRQRRQGLQHRLLRHLMHDVDTALTFRQTAVLQIADETSFIPLVCLMGIDGYDLETDNLESLEERGWSTERICPAGANMLWILYRQDEEDQDVWIRVLLNGQDAELPLHSENAPYYHLGDFKDYYQRKLESYE